MIRRVDPPARSPDIALPSSTAPISHPIWARSPSEDDFERYRPEGAPQAAEAVLACSATAKGALEACTVLFETPAGSDYGIAALRMAKLLRMKGSADGFSVDGRSIVIALNWPSTPATGERPLEARVVTVLSRPRWVKQPRPGVRFPGAASGEAVLLCKVGQDGGLNACQAQGGAPQKAAALAMAKDFRVAKTTEDGGTSAGLGVIVRLKFSSTGMTVGQLP